MILLRLIVNLGGVLISYQILKAVGMMSSILFFIGFLLAFNNSHFPKRKLTFFIGLMLMIISFLLPAILYIL